MRVHHNKLFGHVDLDHILQIDDVVLLGEEAGFSVLFAFQDRPHHRHIHWVDLPTFGGPPIKTPEDELDRHSTLEHFVRLIHDDLLEAWKGDVG